MSARQDGTYIALLNRARESNRNRRLGHAHPETYREGDFSPVAAFSDALMRGRITNQPGYQPVDIWRKDKMAQAKYKVCGPNRLDEYGVSEKKSGSIVYDLLPKKEALAIRRLLNKGVGPDWDEVEPLLTT